jgi:hypothetical protein
MIAASFRQIDEVPVEDLGLVADGYTHAVGSCRVAL